MKQGRQEAFILLLLSACFLAGGILGCLAESRWIISAPAAEYAAEAVADGVTAPALWRELWVLLRWPAFALAAASLPLAGLTMPVLFFLRGFFLSIGISTFMMIGGPAEGLTGALIYGPTCLLALPVFFVAGVKGLRKESEKIQLRTITVSFSALCLCAMLDCRVTPNLLSVILKLSAIS